MGNGSAAVADSHEHLQYDSNGIVNAMLLKALLGSIDLSPAVGPHADYDLLH
jgi:hypothetical protein